MRKDTAPQSPSLAPPVPTFGRPSEETAAKEEENAYKQATLERVLADADRWDRSLDSDFLTTDLKYLIALQHLSIPDARNMAGMSKSTRKKMLFHLNSYGAVMRRLQQCVEVYVANIYPFSRQPAAKQTNNREAAPAHPPVVEVEPGDIMRRLDVVAQYIVTQPSPGATVIAMKLALGKEFLVYFHIIQAGHLWNAIKTNALRKGLLSEKRAWARWGFGGEAYLLCETELPFNHFADDLIITKQGAAIRNPGSTANLDLPEKTNIIAYPLDYNNNRFTEKDTRGNAAGHFEVYWHNRQFCAKIANEDGSSMTTLTGHFNEIFPLAWINNTRHGFPVILYAIDPTIAGATGTKTRHPALRLKFSTSPKSDRNSRPYPLISPDQKVHESVRTYFKTIFNDHGFPTVEISARALYPTLDTTILGIPVETVPHSTVLPLRDNYSMPIIAAFELIVQATGWSQEYNLPIEIPLFSNSADQSDTNDWNTFTWRMPKYIVNFRELPSNILAYLTGTEELDLAYFVRALVHCSAKMRSSPTWPYEPSILFPRFPGTRNYEPFTEASWIIILYGITARAKEEAGNPDPKGSFVCIACSICKKKEAIKSCTSCYHRACDSCSH